MEPYEQEPVAPAWRNPPKLHPSFSCSVSRLLLRTGAKTSEDIPIPPQWETEAFCEGRPMKGLETKSYSVVEKILREYRVTESGCPQNSGRGTVYSRDSLGQEGGIWI